jgi:hypothetical protein
VAGKDDTPPKPNKKTTSPPFSCKSHICGWVYGFAEEWIDQLHTIHDIETNQKWTSDF